MLRAKIFEDDAQGRKVVGAVAEDFVERCAPLFLAQMPAFQFFDVCFLFFLEPARPRIFVEQLLREFDSALIWY